MSTEISATSDSLLARLTHFFQSYAASRAADRPVSQEVRLAAFLDKVRRLRRASAQPERAPAQPRIGVERLERLMATIRAPLLEARERGDQVDVWAVAGLGRHEVRNAAVLAWLLDPRGSHGQGSRLLEAVFDATGPHRPDWLTTEALQGVMATTEERPLGSDRDRVDIAIDGSDFVLFIEVKVDAPEGQEQLVRYIESARAKAGALHKQHWLVVFLSPRPPA